MSQQKKLNAFTVDLEEWYQGIEIPIAKWNTFESRIQASTEELLALLELYGVRATFFVLGCNIPRIKSLLRTITTAGHEIGSHGLNHTFIYRQDKDVFRAELAHAKAVTEDEIQKPLISHRAPYFSITKDSIWALEVLAELGFHYDSSIFPIKNYRYGIPNSPRDLYLIDLPSGNTLYEFPISTVKAFGQTLPCSGGAYFRIYPYMLTRRNIQNLNSHGKPAIFYIHPWELDFCHPRLSLPRRISIPHYFQLRNTVPKLKKLLQDFSFGTLSEVIKCEKPRLQHQAVL